MIEIRKRLEGLLIFNNEVSNLQAQEDQSEMTKKRDQILIDPPSKKVKPRVQKQQDKEQERMLKISPDLIQQFQDEMPQQQQSLELNYLTAEQTHLQTLINLFVGADEVSEYLQLDYFMNLNDILDFELKCLSTIILQNKGLFLTPISHVRKGRSKALQNQDLQLAFYKMRMQQYYEYADFALNFVREVQQKMVQKKKYIDARNNHIYL